MRKCKALLTNMCAPARPPARSLSPSLPPSLPPSLSLSLSVCVCVKAPTTWHTAMIPKLSLNQVHRARARTRERERKKDVTTHTHTEGERVCVCVSKFFFLRFFLLFSLVSVLGLHTMAHQEGVKTISVDIPESAAAFVQVM